MLSTIILTYNEEKNIQSIIDNIVSGVDEILIVDGFSTDHTIDIVKKNNVSFVQREMHDDYGNQRNFAISKAKGDWIFMLDADERCSTNLVKNFKTITTNTPYDGFTILWKNYCDGNLVEVPRKLCLFKRHGHYIDALHEKVNGLKKIANLKDESFFLTHYKSKQEQLDRLRKYKQIILDSIESAKQQEDWKKLEYYQNALKRHTEKETIWLNDYL